VHRGEERVEHCRVRDLGSRPDLLGAGDLVVFNRSAVLPARFAATRQGTGGRVGGLFLSAPAGDQWLVMLESRGTLRCGERLALAPEASLELLEQFGGGQWRVRVSASLGTEALLDSIGSAPLPPYIRKRRRDLKLPEVTEADTRRYNTVYAADPGSVAAPTAGLHFTEELLDALERRGVRSASVTLHVGLGTFAPVRTEHLEGHPIHAEWPSVPPRTIEALEDARARGARIVPVGTTSVRALESLPARLPRAGFTTNTRLYITPAAPGAPAFSFRFTDRLLTNFHLPRSTLLALVAALPGVGIERLKGWYRIAVDREYRFYSYGDAMLFV